MKFSDSSFCNAKIIAVVIAGKVFLGSGSRIIFSASNPVLSKDLLTKSKYLSEVTIIGFLNRDPLLNLCKVRSNRENSLNIGMNCFGLSSVESGHSLLPTPPANNIGLNFFIINKL